MPQNKVDPIDQMLQMGYRLEQAVVTLTTGIQAVRHAPNALPGQAAPVYAASNNPVAGAGPVQILTSIDRVLARIEANTRAVGGGKSSGPSAPAQGKGPSAAALFTAGVGAGGPFAAVTLALGAINPALAAAAVAIKAMVGAALEFAESAARAASPNHLKGLDDSFAYLKGTIGSVLVPAFLALGAAALTAGDKVLEWVKRNEKGVIGTTAKAVGKGFDYVENPSHLLRDYFTTTASNIARYSPQGAVAGLAAKAVGVEKPADKLERFLDRLTGGTSNDFGTGIPAGMKRDRDGNIIKDENSFSEGAKKNYAILAQQQAMSIGGSGYSGIAEAQKNAQIASFDDPLKQKFLDLCLEVIKITNNTAKLVENPDVGP